MRARAADAGKVAEEPARKIDQVGALVDQFAAAGDRGVGAPFAVVAGASAVAVAAADEHHFAQRAGFEDLARLAEGAVKAVIEADADQRAGFAGRPRRRRSSSAEHRAPGFSIEHVLAGGGRGGGDRRQLIVRGRDEDDIDIVAANGGFPIGRRRRAGSSGGQLGGALGAGIAAES